MPIAHDNDVESYRGYGDLKMSVINTNLCPN